MCIRDRARIAHCHERKVFEMGDAADSNKTDNSKLIATDTVYVSPDGGTTNEPFPAPNVEYDFCVDVANTGQLPSGPFFVRFTLSGDQDPPINLDFTQDAGLDAAAPSKRSSTLERSPTNSRHINLMLASIPLPRRRSRSTVQVHSASRSTQ